MLHRLCGPPSIPLSFNLAIVLPRWILNAFAWTLTVYRQHRVSSFTAWTTRVSNPVRSPRFRASASVWSSEAAFAIGVLYHIYAFHRYMIHSSHLNHNSRLTVSMAVLQLSCRLSPLTYNPPTHPLNPINPDNAWTLRITAAAGTELAGPYSIVPSSSDTSECFFPYKSSLQPIGPSSCTRHGWIRLSPIVQYSLLLPPVGVWSVSQYQCGGSSSQTPYPS